MNRVLQFNPQSTSTPYYTDSGKNNNVANLLQKRMDMNKNNSSFKVSNIYGIKNGNNNLDSDDKEKQSSNHETVNPYSIETIAIIHRSKSTDSLDSEEKSICSVNSRLENYKVLHKNNANNCENSIVINNLNSERLPTKNIVTLNNETIKENRFTNREQNCLNENNAKTLCDLNAHYLNSSSSNKEQKIKKKSMELNSTVNQIKINESVCQPFKTNSLQGTAGRSGIVLDYSLNMQKQVACNLLKQTIETKEILAKKINKITKRIRKKKVVNDPLLQTYLTAGESLGHKKAQIGLKRRLYTTVNLSEEDFENEKECHNDSPQKKKIKPNEITKNNELINNVSKKRKISKKISATEKESNNVQDTINKRNLRRSTRERHVPRAYWTSKRTPLLNSLNYYESPVKQNLQKKKNTIHYKTKLTINKKAIHEKNEREKHIEENGNFNSSPWKDINEKHDEINEQNLKTVYFQTPFEWLNCIAEKRFQKKILNILNYNLTTNELLKSTNYEYLTNSRIDRALFIGKLNTKKRFIFFKLQPRAFKNASINRSSDVAMLSLSGSFIIVIWKCPLHINEGQMVHVNRGVEYRLLNQNKMPVVMLYAETKGLPYIKPCQQ